MFEAPRLRVALGLGDQELEWRLRPMLEADDEHLLLIQCLAADQVLRAVEADDVDALIVASGLHRLSDGVLAELERTRLPMLVLAADPDAERWQARRFSVLPLDAPPSLIRQVLDAAARGERRPPPTSLKSAATERVPLKAADRPRDQSQPGTIVAVTGGAGSPGRTTVAINLAMTLGAVAPTVLVELDLSAPSIAAYLNSDPSRNICTLAHVVREAPDAWADALSDELQPLVHGASGAMVLCGLPKRELRSSVTPRLTERLLAELVAHFHYVVLDVGHELLGVDNVAASHRAALAAAGDVLLVSAADMVGLWHARTALKLLERQVFAEAGPPRLSLVLNRHDPRHHHARGEIEWHLGLAAAGVIGFDHAGAQRAIAEQRPMVLDHASRAGRALIELAERVHERHVDLRSALPSPRPPWWARIAARSSRRTVTPAASVTPRPSPPPVNLVPPRESGGQAW